MHKSDHPVEFLNSFIFVGLSYNLARVHQTPLIFKKNATLIFANIIDVFHYLKK